MGMRPRYTPSYAPPGKDSPRAIANAQMLLSSAVSVDQWTPQAFGRQFSLSVRKAEFMLFAERNRRAAR